MLVEHRVDDVDERFVAVEQTVPPSEQVPLQPSLALVLAEHFHYAATRREKLIVRRCRGVPLPVGHFKKRFQTIGECFVRTKNTEIPPLVVQRSHIAQETPEHMRVADTAHSRRWHVNRIVTIVGHVQVAEKQAAIGVWIRAHASFTLRCKVGQFRFQAALRREKFFWLVAPQPVLQQLEMFGMGRRVGERHLMRAERAFNLQAIDHLWPCPSFGRLENNHRPSRPFGVAVCAGIALDFLDLLDRQVERRGHGLVHQAGLVTLDKVRRPPVAAE